MEEFARSDVVTEQAEGKGGEGILTRRSSAGGCEILQVQIKSEQAAKRVGRPQGRYITVECGNVATLDAAAAEQVCCVLAAELRELARSCCKKPIGAELSLLVVGLGNAAVTPDSLGAQTVSALCVTRHLQESERMLLAGGGAGKISAIPIGVSGQTGISGVDLVRGAVLTTSPDLVLAVDALAARSPQRLGSTVQLCDTGICPGSGMGKGKGTLNADTVGVPVLAIGVATVVNSATLAVDALRLAGHARLAEDVRAALRRVQQLFVTPSEIDVLIKAAAVLLAQAIEKAFLHMHE